MQSFDIDPKALATAMPCMLDLRDVFQRVINRLNYCSLAEHQLIEDIHQLVKMFRFIWVTS